MKWSLFWRITFQDFVPSNLVEISRKSTWHRENEGSIFLRNVCKFLRDYTASYSRRDFHSLRRETLRTLNTLNEIGLIVIKVRISPCSCHEELWEGVGTAPCLLNFGTRWKRVVNCTYDSWQRKCITSWHFEDAIDVFISIVNVALVFQGCL
jgi:hypothetical protein